MGVQALLVRDDDVGVTDALDECRSTVIVNLKPTESLQDAEI